MKQGIQGRQSPPILQSLSEQSMSPFVLFPLIRRSAHSERLLVHSPLHASWDDSLGVLGADVEHTQHLCFLLLNCSNGKNQPWRLTFAKQMTKRSNWKVGNLLNGSKINTVTSEWQQAVSIYNTRRAGRPVDPNPLKKPSTSDIQWPTKLEIPVKITSWRTSSQMGGTY